MRTFGPTADSGGDSAPARNGHSRAVGTERSALKSTTVSASSFMSCGSMRGSPSAGSSGCGPTSLGLSSPVLRYVNRPPRRRRRTYAATPVPSTTTHTRPAPVRTLFVATPLVSLAAFLLVGRSGERSFFFFFFFWTGSSFGGEFFFWTGSSCSAERSLFWTGSSCSEERSFFWTGPSLGGESFFSFFWTGSSLGGESFFSFFWTGFSFGAEFFLLDWFFVRVCFSSASLLFFPGLLLPFWVLFLQNRLSHQESLCLFLCMQCTIMEYGYEW